MRILKHLVHILEYYIIMATSGGHNIHGTILNNPVSEVLGGKSNPHKYGITAGATKQYPDKKQNKKGLLGFWDYE